MTKLKLNHDVAIYEAQLLHLNFYLTVFVLFNKHILYVVQNTLYVNLAFPQSRCKKLEQCWWNLFVQVSERKRKEETERIREREIEYHIWSDFDKEISFFFYR